MQSGPLRPALPYPARRAGLRAYLARQPDREEKEGRAGGAGLHYMHTYLRIILLCVQVCI